MNVSVSPTAPQASLAGGAVAPDPIALRQLAARTLRTLMGLAESLTRCSRPVGQIAADLRATAADLSAELLELAEARGGEA